VKESVSVSAEVRPRSVMAAGALFALNQKKRAAEARMKSLREAFKKADKDGDGELDQAEWMEVMREAGVDMTR